jgi:hypothetical protein
MHNALQFYLNTFSHYKCLEQTDTKWKIKAIKLWRMNDATAAAEWKLKEETFQAWKKLNWFQISYRLYHRGYSRFFWLLVSRCNSLKLGSLGSIRFISKQVKKLSVSILFSTLTMDKIHSNIVIDWLKILSDPINLWNPLIWLYDTLLIFSSFP